MEIVWRHVSSCEVRVVSYDEALNELGAELDMSSKDAVLQIGDRAKESLAVYGDRDQLLSFAEKLMRSVSEIPEEVKPPNSEIPDETKRLRQLYELAVAKAGEILPVEFARPFMSGMSELLAEDWDWFGSIDGMRVSCRYDQVMAIVIPARARGLLDEQQLEVVSEHEKDRARAAEDGDGCGAGRG